MNCLKGLYIAVLLDSKREYKIGEGARTNETAWLRIPSKYLWFVFVSGRRQAGGTVDFDVF
jgi:hypothetical protein